MIRELEGDKGERAIIELSYALDLSVFAESVEAESQLGILEALGCDRAKGFLFAPSVAPGAIEESVTSPRRG